MSARHCVKSSSDNREAFGESRAAAYSLNAKTGCESWSGDLIALKVSEVIYM
jgi:hypothetical protein